MSSNLDLSKPVQTRDGHPVVILATTQTSHGLEVWGRFKSGGYTRTRIWNEYGNCNKGKPHLDLLNVPVPPRCHRSTFWVAAFGRDIEGMLYDSKTAIRQGYPNATAYIPVAIEWKDGHCLAMSPEEELEDEDGWQS